MSPLAPQGPAAARHVRVPEGEAYGWWRIEGAN